MSGYIALHRSVFNHPMLRPGPFNETLAWIWLLSEAAWQPKRVRVGRAVFALERGQLAHSIRFLAEKWQWSVKEVRGFLQRITNDGAILVKTTSEGTIITICNYDDWQPEGQTKGQAEGKLRASQGHKEEEDNNIKKIDDEDPAEPTAKSIDREAIETTQEIGRICGFRDALDWPWVSPVDRVRAWLQAGWRKAVILESVRAQMARKRDGPPNRIQYFEKGIAQAHSQNDSPLPDIPSESIQHANFKRPAPGTDDILAKMREFGA